ncbi:MAG: DNA-3-methyladenine glycosylase 2 family protein [Edafosvirus sp.]|uniref:DNA-3-methyladenine glycosylase 2 family protein n=1 Tax=Edafosvirus sp. TaxID=2487765 RepID=A0A3G4ZVL1_9VIRU|nr:MAG: DNA-3-methyladenine glycosylase 2 family protein [Edafosvirus sp.]
MYTHTYKISLKGPCNFDFTLQLNKNDTYNDQLIQTLVIKNKIVVLFIKNIGSIEKPVIQFKIYSKHNVNINDVKNHIDKIIGEDIDLRRFYKDIRHDKVLKEITKQLYGLQLVMKSDPFESIMYAICEQQLSYTVSVSIEQKIIKKFGRSIEINGKTLYTIPIAEDIAKNATVAKLKSCGLSGTKAKSLLNIAKKIYKGDLDLDELRTYDTPTIIETLMELKGIGIWSAEYICIRGYGRYDTIMAEDSALQKNVSKYYKIKNITVDKVNKLAQSWDEWKGLASFYLFMAGHFL